MPANFKYYDSYGTERTVANVLEPVELTEVDVTSGDTFISVDPRREIKVDSMAGKLG